MKYEICFCICLLCTIHVTFGQFINQTRIYLERTLFALESGLKFFDREHSTANFDAIIGTRIVEGQLDVLLRRIGNAPELWNVDVNTFNRIRGIARLAGAVSDKSIPYSIFRAPGNYYSKETIVQRGFWSLNYRSRNFPFNVQIWPYRPDEAYPISISDYCISWAIGKRPETTQQCVIPTQCWSLMRTPGFSGYALSHQIFYTVIGLMNGCGSEFERTRLLFGDPSLDDLQTLFCANMLNEARIIANNGYRPHRQDLFAENAALCGILGFRQFFNYEWLERILSWQDPIHGCFKQNPSLRVNASIHGRKKRAERRMIDGCLAHKTTVTIAALAQYVRYLLEEIAAQNRLRVF